MTTASNVKARRNREALQNLLHYIAQFLPPCCARKRGPANVHNIPVFIANDSAMTDRVLN